MTTRPPPLTIGGREFAWGRRTYVMGVLNITLDSFSGDGLGYDVEAAVAQGRRFAAEGADILDVGGESTRPDFDPVSADEEIRRTLPVIERLLAEVDLPISIDTSKAKVAQAALGAGAHLLNDVSGLRHDPEMASAGVPRERLIIDPGFGFGWTEEQNLEILRRLGELRDLGLPILVGTSRKSTIGAVLGLPVEERLMGTAATVAIAIARGADIVRVHDVKEMVQVCRMTDAVVRTPAEA